MSKLDQIIEAMRTEFAGTVSFSPTLPTTFTAPQVVVAPGDPFLVNETMTGIRETWRVLVVVATKDPARGMTMLRELSLRTRKAVGSVGGVRWEASGHNVVGSDSTQVVSINLVSFTYDPAQYTDS